MAIELDSRSRQASPAERAGSAQRTALPQWSGRRRVSDLDRMFFTERLALLLDTGNTLHASLEMIEPALDHPEMRRVVAALRSDIAGGAAFAEALSRHPQVFPETYVHLVAASEEGGFTGRVLQQLHENEERQQQLAAVVRGALTYPVFLLVISAGVIVFVLTSVFPRFADMFESIADNLPLSTRILMGISDLFVQHWPWLLAALALSASALWRALQRPEVRLRLDRLKLRLPFLRRVYLELYMAQLMRAMGLSLSNGVSVIDTLRACRGVVRNAGIQALLEAVESDVATGEPLAASLGRSGVLPPMVQQMIATGEASGRLGTVTTRLAEHYERELSRRLATLSKVAEPALLLFMGAIVGLLVSSLILPIFQLSKAVH